MERDRPCSKAVPMPWRRCSLPTARACTMSCPFRPCWAKPRPTISPSSVRAKACSTRRKAGCPLDSWVLVSRHRFVTFSSAASAPEASGTLLPKRIFPFQRSMGMANGPACHETCALSENPAAFSSSEWAPELTQASTRRAPSRWPSASAGRRPACSGCSGNNRIRRLRTGCQAHEHPCVVKILPPVATASA